MDGPYAATVPATIDDLQRFLVAVASPGRDVIRVAPFTLYLDPDSDNLFHNYAIPDAGVGDVVAAALEDLRVAFRSRDRVARFEYLDEYAPALGAALARAGLVEHVRTPFMQVAPATLVAPSMSLDLATVEELSDRDLVDWRRAQRIAYGDPADDPGGDARDPRSSATAVVVVQGGGEVIGGAVASPIVAGIAEIQGVFCVETWRRRGVAGAATAAAAGLAFRRGATSCVLTPGDEGAMRVYARAGFAPVATSTYWRDP